MKSSGEREWKDVNGLAEAVLGAPAGDVGDSCNSSLHGW